MKKVSLLLAIAWISSTSLASAQKPAAPADKKDAARVFITDSQSWEMGSYSGGGPGGGGSVSKGGARPQTAEIIKTFGERCPDVVTNNIPTKSDYIVLLDHEGGKSFVRHKNKVAVFARISGDSIVSKSTVSLGHSVQEACDAIRADWAKNATALRAAANGENKPAADPPSTSASAPAPAAQAALAAAPATAPAAADPPSPLPMAKLSINSAPDGADIEVDGAFAGNTPSDVQVSEGEHLVAVKKTGFKDWQKSLKVNGGSNIRLNAELQKIQ